MVLFILLGGYPPFYDESEPALFAQIRKGSFSFDDPVWDTISDRYTSLGLCNSNSWDPACYPCPATLAHDRTAPSIGCFGLEVCGRTAMHPQADSGQPVPLAV